MKERFKEIWKETVKKHLRKWRRLPGIAFQAIKLRQVTSSLNLLC